MPDMLKLARDPDLVRRFQALRRADLLPFLFKLGGAPYTLKDHIQMREFFDKEYVPDTIMCCGRQVSKCASVVHLTKEGLHAFCKADGSPFTEADLVVGAKVLSYDGAGHIVEGVISNVWKGMEKQSLRIHTRTGRQIDCSTEHKVLKASGYSEAESLKIGDRLLAVRRGGTFRNEPQPESRVAITAYMLGDGCCTLKGSTKQPTFTTGSAEVMCDISRFFPELSNKFYRQGERNARTLFIGKNHIVTKWLESDGLIGHYAYDKFIPDWVFRLPIKQTRDFIGRIWATDGMVKCHNGRPTISFCTTSPALARGMRSLLMKLGMLASVKRRETGYATKNGERKRCRDSYIIRIEGPESQRLFCETIRVPGKPPVCVHSNLSRSNRDTLPREMFRYLEALFSRFSASYKEKSLRTHNLRLNPKYPLSRIKLQEYLNLAVTYGLENENAYQILHGFLHGDVFFDEIDYIERIGVKECFDIEVETFHNFVLDGLVVHNSKSLSYSEILDCISTPYLQLLYVAPLQSQAQRYSTLYIKEAIQSCPFAMKLQAKELEGALADSKIMKAVGHQSFANGAGLQLMYAKTSPDRARGIMADRIDFDEIQDQLFDTVPIVSQSIKASKYGIRKFTGTAKTLDNTIERLWQQSSKREWVMKCEHCGYENIPTKDGGIMNMPQPDGVHCVNPRCRRRLNVRNGRWIAFSPEKDNSFRGFHIPQIVVPFMVEHRGRWAQIWNDIQKLPESLVMQEVFGISESSGSRIIDETHIRKQSTLPTMDVLRNNLDRYVMTLSGVDWGGAEENSFTVHVIIGIRADGRVDVLYAQRYHAFDPDRMFLNIAKAHRLYKCGIMAADYGLGFQNNLILMGRFGIPVVQMNFVRQNTPLGFATTNRGNERWTIDKTSGLRAMFMAIKYGRIYFPPYLEFEPYTADLLSPFEHVIETGGLTTIVYQRDPARPDDFAMALCFVLMAAVKVAGLDILDLIPKSAFSGGAAVGKPKDVLVDPKDYMARE